MVHLLLQNQYVLAQLLLLLLDLLTVFRNVLILLRKQEQNVLRQIVKLKIYIWVRLELVKLINLAIFLFLIRLQLFCLRVRIYVCIHCFQILLALNLLSSVLFLLLGHLMLSVIIHINVVFFIHSLRLKRRNPVFQFIFKFLSQNWGVVLVIVVFILSVFSNFRDFRIVHTRLELSKSLVFLAVHELVRRKKIVLLFAWIKIIVVFQSGCFARNRGCWVSFLSWDKLLIVVFELFNVKVHNEILIKLKY